MKIIKNKIFKIIILIIFIILIFFKNSIIEMTYLFYKQKFTLIEKGIVDEVENNPIFYNNGFQYYSFRNRSELYKNNGEPACMNSYTTFGLKKESYIAIEDYNQLKELSINYCIWDIVKTDEFLQISIFPYRTKFSSEYKIILKTYVDIEDIKFDYSNVFPIGYRIFIKNNLKFQKLDKDIYVIRGKEAIPIY